MATCPKHNGKARAGECRGGWRRVERQREEGECRAGKGDAVCVPMTPLASQVASSTQGESPRPRADRSTVILGGRCVLLL